jgi:hypothetical protein
MLHSLAGLRTPVHQIVQPCAGRCRGLSNPDRLAAGRGTPQAGTEFHDLATQVVPHLAQLLHLSTIGVGDHLHEFGML